MRVGLIDYGVGNLGSVLRALEVVGVNPLLVRSPEHLTMADQLILPGVGNFADCRAMLDAGGWVQPLLAAVRDAGRPLLGICVGMHLLATAGAEGSERGDDAGLGLIPGRVESLRVLGCRERVPHVGWNGVTRSEGEAGELLAGIPNGTDFYFTHSYMFVPDHPALVAGRAHYDIAITAAVRSGPVWGTQFHPEKSSGAGLKVIRNFIERASC